MERKEDNAGVAVDNTTELDILHSIKPIEITGAVYSPHKGEEGVSIPEKLGMAMVKKGWAKKAKVTHCKVQGADLKTAAQWIKGTGNISGAQIAHGKLSTYFVAATDIWGGKVVTPLKEVKGKCAFAFDSERLYKCLFTSKKGEEVEVKIRPSTLEIKDKDGRQWVHKLPGTEEMHYIKKMKALKTGSVNLFLTAAKVRELKQRIREEVKKNTDVYVGIVFVTGSNGTSVYLEGSVNIEKVDSLTGDKLGERLSLYPLDAFMTVLKGVKAQGKNEGLELNFGPGEVLKATFPIGSSQAVVYVAGKTEERREEVREILNPSPSVAEEEKKAKDAIDRIQEQERREQEKHKEEPAFKETEETVKKWKDTYNEVKEIREGVSFLTVREATGAKFNCSSDVYLDMQAETKVDRECMWVLHLNGGNKVVKKELVAMGKGNAAIVTPREVYRRAIIEGMTSIIMVHNHPSGDPTPSDADIQICKKFKDAGELLGVLLLDFMVIGTDGYTSFTDERLGGF